MSFLTALDSYNGGFYLGRKKVVSQRRSEMKNLHTGMKMHHFGGEARNSAFSGLDGAQIITNANKLDTQGVQELVYLDRSGNPLTVRHHNGRVIVANQRGAFRQVDLDVMRHHIQRKKDVQEVVEEVLELCLWDDEVTMEILGFSEDEYDTLFGPIDPDDWADVIKQFDMPKRMNKDIAMADCRSSAMIMYGASPDQYSARAFAKLRYIITRYLPEVRSSGITEQKLLGMNDDTQGAGDPTKKADKYLKLTAAPQAPGG